MENAEKNQISKHKDYLNEFREDKVAQKVKMTKNVSTNGIKRDNARIAECCKVIVETPTNAPEVDVLPGVADFDFAFARFGLGAGVDSSSWSSLLEDEEVVEVVESLDAGSKASGTTNCRGSDWTCWELYTFGWV